MGAIINSYNVKVLREPEARSRTCNCRPETKGGPIICPLDGKCLTKCIIYKASVTAPGKSTKTYIGLSEREFKDRYTKHKHSFTEVKRRNDTSLSAYMWSLKDEGHQGRIKWEIAMRSRPYKCGTRRCDLCTSEKLSILLANSTGLLNKRSEIIAMCRHRSKFKCKTKDKPSSCDL